MRQPRGDLMPASFILNGEPTTLDADPTMPLLWALREVAGLNGTKFGPAVANAVFAAIGRRSRVLPFPRPVTV